MVACACLLLLGLAGLPADGGNAHLARARGEVEQLQYDAARTSLERALKAGGSTPAETRELYLLSAEVAAALGDRAGAERNYRHLLALDPAARLAAGASPKLSRPFAAARASMRGRGAIKLRAERSRGPRPAVDLVVVADPLRLVAGARVQCRTDSGAVSTHAATGTGRVTVALPRAARVEVVLSAVDRHGNRLIDLGPFTVRGAAVTATGPAGPLPGSALGPADGGLPLLPRWILYTAAATTLLVASGITFGVLANSAQNDIDHIVANSRQHSYADLLAAKRRGDWQAIVSNVSFGVSAAGAAIIATYYFVRLHRRSKATVLASPTRSGGFLQLSASF